MEKRGMKKGTGAAKSTAKVKIMIVIGAVFAVAAIIGIISWVLWFSNTKEMRDVLDVDTIYPNILANGVNIGGMKKEDAIKKLQRDAQEPFDQNEITFIIDDEEVKFTYKQFNVKLDIEGAVEKAYNYAREGSVEERYELYERLKINDVYSFDIDYLTDEGNLPEETVTTIRSELEKGLKDKVYIPPKDATLKKDGSGFTTTAEENGRELDLDRAVDTVVEYITIGEGDGLTIHTPTKEIETPVKEIQANVTKAQLSQVKDVIGKYSTKYSGSGSSGRVINMRVAASRLNGKIINPGEVFSTNECFGESTPENGYKLAGAYINGKLDQDYGGGVCQVSSTLYNAVLRAELDVVERSNHSLTVGYVPRGFDATLAGDYIDFKFKNDTSVPVYIESGLTGNQVSITLYGKEIHSPNRTLEFKNTFTGGAYKTYKEVYQDGKFIEKVYLSRSVYKNIKDNGNGVPVEVKLDESTTAKAVVTEAATEPVSMPTTVNNESQKNKKKSETGKNEQATNDNVTSNSQEAHTVTEPTPPDENGGVNSNIGTDTNIDTDMNENFTDDLIVSPNDVDSINSSM
ncbi:MAG: hypothetical protein HFE59_04585 [Clostridiales bacterium]|nr:hypothetical protein [Clostridiales bacterium]